jgi:two-component system KDP operon response regulator KdpE
MTTKVLLVDDDPTLLRFLSEYLRNDQFVVYAESNGPSGLKVCYEEHPDLVVLDVMMPGMDGWELCARLREMSTIPIILLTAKTTEADKLRGFRLGVDDYVTKPFSFAELSARIRAILQRSHMAAVTANQTIVQFADMELNTDKRQLNRNGAEIELTPTEYRLLEVLALQIGKAVSEEDLGRAVWGAYREDNSKTVRRYIWLLRQKIEKNPSEPEVVKTVRGYGYRLN